MIAFDVERTFVPFTEFGPRARELMRFFGMTLDTLHRRAIPRRLSLTLKAGQVCYLTGPSGAGKSVLLDALYEQTPADLRSRIESVTLESDAATIDCIDGPLRQSLELLCQAGLSDVPCLLQPPAALSDGQKWRYRLAKTLAGGKPILFADEFCAALDEITARAVAYNVRRTADRTGRLFILAGCREDILTDLAPDVLVAVSGTTVDVKCRPFLSEETI
jgi:hypothetical protein